MGASRAGSWSRESWAMETFAVAGSRECWAMRDVRMQRRSLWEVEVEVEGVGVGVGWRGWEWRWGRGRGWGWRSGGVCTARMQ